VSSHAKECSLCVDAHFFLTLCEARIIYPIKLAYVPPTFDRCPAKLTVIALDRLSAYVSSRRTCWYTEVAVFFTAVAVTMASAHCGYSEEMVRLSPLIHGWLIMKTVEPRKVARACSSNTARRNSADVSTAQRCNRLIE